jgi:hypothetical protein
MTRLTPIITEAQLTHQLEKTIKAIQTYKFEKWDSVVTMQQLAELVSELLGSNIYEDEVLTYEQNVVALLGFLLLPEVTLIYNKHLPLCSQNSIPKMLVLLQDFFRQLNGEYFLIQILLTNLTHQATPDMQKLKEVEVAYHSKLDALLIERITSGQRKNLL